MYDLIRQAEHLQDNLIRHRRWLHQHPGTGFDLSETREYVRQQLTAMGLSPVNCGKCGLMAEISGKPGKTILLRADMDALPLQEETNEEFASTNGSMHACGHDCHTAMLLGAARLLLDNCDELNGTVKLMFQPAEEIFEGAKDMIAHGALDGADAAVMVHVTVGMPIPAGTVIVSAPGVTAPAADYFTINVQGKGCHGSTPQNGVDALTAAAHILIALQELHARELPAGSEAVLTIGKMTGGTAGNAIADTAQMEGTIRTYDEDTRAFLKSRIGDISQAIATAFRAEATIQFGSGCPTLKNDPQLCESFHQYLVELLGPQKALAASALSGGKPVRGCGSEDFAYVRQRIPSVMLALAAGEPRLGYQHPLHHPKVRIDENALTSGTAALAQIAIKYLAAQKEAPQRTP